MANAKQQFFWITAYFSSSFFYKPKTGHFNSDNYAAFLFNIYTLSVSHPLMLKLALGIIQAEAGAILRHTCGSLDNRTTDSSLAIFQSG